MNEMNGDFILLTSEMPTHSPTFDPRPTLEIVQERGRLLCGVEEGMGGINGFMNLVSFFFFYKQDIC